MGGGGQAGENLGGILSARIATCVLRLRHPWVLCCVPVGACPALELSSERERSGALPAGSPPFSGRTSEAPSPQLSPRLVASWEVADPCSAASQISICAGGLWQLRGVVGLVSAPLVVPGLADGAVNVTRGGGLPGRTAPMSSWPACEGSLSLRLSG